MTGYSHPASNKVMDSSNSCGSGRSSSRSSSSNIQAGRNPYTSWPYIDEIKIGTTVRVSAIAPYSSRYTSYSIKNADLSRSTTSINLVNNKK